MDPFTRETYFYAFALRQRVSQRAPPAAEDK